MVVFKYIEDKDVFQKFYSKMLAKRLCHHMSASDDAEASMISKLKQACGFEYTSKLQRMFQDIGVSKDLNEQYKQHVKGLRDATRQQTGNEIDFSILVLSSGSWPFNQSFTFSLPFEVSSCRENYSFITLKHLYFGGIYSWNNLYIGLTTSTPNNIPDESSTGCTTCVAVSSSQTTSECGTLYR